MADYTSSSEYYWRAMRAIQEGTQQAVTAGTSAINTGTGYLNQQTGLANATLSPQTQASYAALDSYFDVLGIARPTVGSAAVAGASGLGTYNANEKDQLKTALQKVIQGMPDQQRGRIGDSLRRQAETALQSDNVDTMESFLKGMASRGGNWVENAAQGLAKDALSTVQLNSTDIRKLAATPDGLQKLQLAQQIREGNLQTGLTPQNQMSPEAQSISNAYNTSTTNLNTVNQQMTGLLARNPATMTPEQAQGLQAQLAATPGYQFALNQGIGAVQNSAAAKGMLNSGRTIQGVADYATGLADQTYNTYVNQFNQSVQAMQGNVNSLAQQQASAANQRNQYVGLLANAFGQTNAATGQVSQNQMQLGGMLNQNQGYLADLGANAALTSANAISSLYAGQGAQQFAAEHMQSSSGFYPQLQGGF